MQSSSFNVPALRWKQVAALRALFRKITLAVAAVFTLGLFCQVSVAQEPPALTFEAACQQAAATQKLVVLEFFSYNAAESKMLRDVVLEAGSVKALLAEKFLVVPVEFERQAELCARYGVNRPSVLLVAKADGTEVDRLAGRIDPDQFLEVLQAALSGQSTLTSLKERVIGKDAGVEAHYGLGLAYTRRRQLELALSEYRWCLGQGQAMDPVGYRRHLAVVLFRLGALGLELPAAKTVLEEHREKAQAAVTANPTAFNYEILFKFNSAFKQSGRNADLFLALAANSPLRTSLFEDALPVLIEQRRYKEITAAGDIETWAGRPYPLMTQVDAPPVEDAKDGTHEHTDLRRQRVIDVTATAVEVLLGANLPEKARRVAGRALEFDSSRMLRVRLIEGAQRAASTATPDFIEWVKTYGTAASSPQPPAKP